MNAFIQRILGKLSSGRSTNGRKDIRVLWDSSKPKYVKLKQENGREVQAKLINLSDTGCQLVVSNSHIFEETPVSIDFDTDFVSRSSAQPRKANVVWTMSHNLDIQRCCYLGVRFETEV